MSPIWHLCMGTGPAEGAFQTVSRERQAMDRASTSKWKIMATNGDGVNSGYRTAVGSSRPLRRWLRNKSKLSDTDCSITAVNCRIPLLWYCESFAVVISLSELSHPSRTLVNSTISASPSSSNILLYITQAILPESRQGFLTVGK
jgi:hypothetical protein